MNHKGKVVLVISVVFLFASSVLIVIPRVHAATINVNSGMTTAQINAAIAGASSGDIVQFAAGTYNLQAPLVVGVAGVILQGDTANPDNVVINAPTTGTDKDCFQVTANHVTIQGFRMQGARDVIGNWNSGIAIGNYVIAGIEYTTISRNKITDCSYGIYHYRAQHTTISHNEIWACPGSPEGNWNGKGIIVFGYGTYTDTQNHDVDILYNEIHDNDIIGIELNHGDCSPAGPVDVDVWIHGNTIYDNGGGMEHIGGAGLSVDFYRGISSNGYDYNVKITNNEIYGHVAGTGSRFYGGCAAIRATSDQNWEISNNNIHDNFRGIYAYGGSTGFVITKNDVYDNAQGIVVDDGNVGYAHCNNIYNNNVNTWTGLSCPWGHGNGDPIGFLNRGTSTFDAEKNWWGHKTGPYHSTLNPSGQGDTVSDYIDFDPWELSYPACAPVGGVWVPINKTELLAPWITLASLVTVATVSIIYVKRRKKLQN